MTTGPRPTDLVRHKVCRVLSAPIDLHAELLQAPARRLGDHLDGAELDVGRGELEGGEAMRLRGTTERRAARHRPEHLRHLCLVTSRVAN